MKSKGNVHAMVYINYKKELNFSLKHNVIRKVRKLRT